MKPSNEGTVKVERQVRPITCPLCGGTDQFKERPYSLDDNTICQDIQCENCDGSWSRIFTFDHNEPAGKSL